MIKRIRGRSVATTAALAGVLLALAAYVIQGTVHTTRATEQQSRALVVDSLFSEARIAIAMQEVNLRHYQVEPSVAVKQRFDQVVRTANDTLAQIVAGDDGAARADALRLREEQLAYQALAERLIVLIADSDPAHSQLDRLEVTPAFYTLQDDVDTVARAYHDAAQLQVAALRQTQVRLLVGTSVGFGAGLFLVGMILRLVLGYQRRLVDQATESRHLALHDPLTGLANRTLFTQRLAAALENVDDGQVALMVVDLNGFKAVNDTMGHHAGDRVLIESGRRLTAGVGADGVVARLGGDEFAVLLPRVSGIPAASALAEHLVGELRRDFALDDGPAAISGSLGIALGPMHGGADELFRHADAAMYRAKSNGGGVAVYDAGADAEMPDRMQLFADLRALLDGGDPHGQLRLYYQPQVRLSDGAVTSVEALVRWLHPERGLLMPGTFLPIAERGGLEVRLTYHLLGVAVRQAAEWLREDRPLSVSVNVSPGCLIDPGFVARVLAAAGEAGLPPHLLCLELTETSIMADPDRAVRALHEVREHGISVSVDDFGTGFSSLSQLRRVPADELKVDRTFVRDLTAGTPDAVMVRSAIELGHNLGLSVVAEGVEDEEALLRLREMNCEYAQGYVLSHPVPADKLRDACDRAQAVVTAVLVA
ncbi:putative bifunctional diguanylate cyclase/phosphodiesterase [Actinoplanes friuliensis]|uniref:Signaling protein ykoW n=1 Tax=Actinoplanes friuliensis DSM 7358 TaxID=1246995 RepID=U5VZD0_9ACTN|nr:EAL domain-containing protein [Actinoplanes friuliensis]AGZ42353.1 Signaling protein ykoW [Actinoplanes friuliensis DSM 7358]